MNPTRTGLLDMLRSMGGEIDIVNPRSSGSEPVADLQVRASVLHGIEVPVDLVPLAIDELPVLFIAAACAAGETVVTGAEELRVKESDRIAAMSAGLTTLGVVHSVMPDGMCIEGRGLRAQPLAAGSSTVSAITVSPCPSPLPACGPPGPWWFAMWPTWPPRFRDLSAWPGRSGSMCMSRRLSDMPGAVPIMTIDGPSGSGKGTVSRAAARARGWALLDSGALYRLVALAGRRAGVALDDGAGLGRLGGELPTSASVRALRARKSYG